MAVGFLCMSGVTRGQQELRVITPAGAVHLMVLVPAGEFHMGSDAGWINVAPERIVYLDSFYIDRYEVTNQLFMNYLAYTGGERSATPSTVLMEEPALAGPEQPVVGVDWREAVGYCQWAGLRLPSEAEWEKAARGTDGRNYPWGEGLDRTKGNWGSCREDVCGYGDDSDGYYYTAPVGSYPSGISPYGAYDMFGNVAEWVADWYSDTYYQEAPSRNPPGPEVGVWRSVRSVGWRGSSAEQPGDVPVDPLNRDYPTWARSCAVPESGFEDVGFRCARSAEEERGTNIEVQDWGGVKTKERGTSK